MIPHPDIYQDKIMLDHPSRSWTGRFIQEIDKILPTWKKRTISAAVASWSNNNHKCVIGANLVHKLSPVFQNSTGNNLIITDTVLPGNKSYIKLFPEVFGVYYQDFEYDSVLPSKNFNCFIHRACAFRQSWLYQIIRRNLLDQAYVSYWCHDRDTNKSPKEYFDYLYQFNTVFEQEHEKIRQHIPFKNFDCSLEYAILDTKKTLIIETFFDTNDSICFSEKTWRAIQMPRPWLLFSTPMAVQYLREWGFDVFDDVVDHSYDTEPDTIKRQVMILYQLELDIKYNNKILREFELRATKNKNLLKHYQQQWPDKLKKIIQQVTQISNNESLTLRA